MRKTGLLFCLLFFVSLAGCADSRQKNTLLQDASPETSAMELYIYDGDVVTRSFLFDEAEEKRILQELSSVSAEKVDDWSPGDVTFPIYGIGIGKKGEGDIQAAWSNGYWIAQEGDVYLFDRDFGALAADHEWGEPDTWKTIAAMPCARYLCQDGDGWYEPLLTPAEQKDAPEDITCSIVSQTGDTITAAFSDRGDEGWTYGEYFSLEVRLDDIWYHVPPVPGDWGFKDIACILPAGETREQTYDLTMYGDLPDGAYRLVAEDLTAEFALPAEDRFR